MSCLKNSWSSARPKAACQMVDEEAEDIVAAVAARYLEIGCAALSPTGGGGSTCGG